MPEKVNQKEAFREIKFRRKKKKILLLLMEKKVSNEKYQLEPSAHVIRLTNRRKRHARSQISSTTTVTGEESKNIIHVTIGSIKNHRPIDTQSKISRSHINTNDTKRKTPSTLTDSNFSTKEHHKKRIRNKKLSYFWKYCSCCRLSRTIFFIIGALLIATALAALLVGLLTKKQTTTVTETSTTRTTVTTTTTTSTTTKMTLLATKNITVYGIWNTTVGGDSIAATSGTTSVGNYYPGETPNNVFDNNTSTKYTNFGACIYAVSSTYSLQCGENTGFYFTSVEGPSLLLSVQFCTGNDNPERDPFTITIEGSNQSPSLLTLGSSWTLIYNGSTGLQSVLSRLSCGAVQPVLNNTVWYSSYRFLVTSKRDVNSGAQYSEVKLNVYL